MDVPDALFRKLDELDEQFEALSKQLLDPDVLSDHRQVRTLSIKKAAIEGIVTDYRAYRDALREQGTLSIAAGESAVINCKAAFYRCSTRGPWK